MRYDPGQLDAEVTELPGRPLGLHDDSELSIAGLQNKLLLVRLPDGGWARPVHGFPSTHILKVDDPRHPGLVAAEAGCLALARTLGLSSGTAELVRLGDEECLIVSRFDRWATADERIVRIHQEDMLQALGVDCTHLGGRVKYERYGGPSLVDVAALLSSFAADPPIDLDRLVRVVTFNVLIGNASAHAKNLSLVHDPLGRTTLAPLYDTVPTVLWPKLRTTAAMSVAGRAELSAITLADVAAEAGRWGHSPARAERVARELVEAAREAIEHLPVPDRVATLVRERAASLLA